MVFAGATPPSTTVTISQAPDSRDINFSFVCTDTESGCNKLFYVIDEDLNIIVSPDYSFDGFEDQSFTDGNLVWTFAAGNWAIVSDRAHSGTYSMSDNPASTNNINTEERIGYIDNNFYA